MTVLFLVDRWSNGGVPVVIQQIRDHLKREGHTSFLISYYASKYPLPEDALCLNARFGGDWKVVGALRSWLRTHEPDVIHDHFGGIWALGYILSKSWASRSILHYHNEPFPIKDSPDHHPRWKRWLETILVKKYALTLGVSRHTTRQLMDLGVHPTKAQVSYNAIDLSLCLKQRAEANDKIQIKESTNHILTIGMVARLVFEKGVDTFLETLKNLQLRNIEFQAWIIGDGDPLYEQRMKEFVKKEGLERRVTFWGRIENVHPLLEKIDLFFFASRQEPFGLTLLEAMAHECIITGVLPENGGGPHEFLTPFNSVMTTERNPIQLAEMIIRLKANEVLQQRIREEAKHTLAQFTMEEMGKKVLHFYHQVAKN